MEFAKNANALYLSSIRNIVSKKRGGVHSECSLPCCLGKSYQNASGLTRLFLFLFILIFSLSFVSVSPVLWSWSCNETVNFFGYQLIGQAGDSWIVVNSNTTSARQSGTESSHSGGK